MLWLRWFDFSLNELLWAESLGETEDDNFWDILDIDKSVNSKVIFEGARDLWKAGVL